MIPQTSSRFDSKGVSLRTDPVSHILSVTVNQIKAMPAKGIR